MPSTWIYLISLMGLTFENEFGIGFSNLAITQAGLEVELLIKRRVSSIA